MATIDDVVDKGKGAVEATKDYGVREVKHGFWDKFYEGTLAVSGAIAGYYLYALNAAAAASYSVGKALASSFIGLSVGYTTAQLTSLPVNIYHNIKSFFQFGRELIGGGKTKIESQKSKPPSGLPQPAGAH
ncbi:MAG TPA: hypothetical protein VJI52_03765 [Candidatus Nanoarchaeia archaeon]|nr:hypothetical protein [Candidatus Nanoarchaeia archaeon]